MSLNPVDMLAHPDTLLWAFKKVQKQLYWAEGIVDPLPIAKFELNLSKELQSISNDFKNCNYTLDPLILSPIPKKFDEFDNNRVIARQFFEVSVRDQVAWTAMSMVLGPDLDSQMPSWSYGHRLYRATWFEDSDQNAHVFRQGHYRHANGQFYRRFGHSWPLYKRHLMLAGNLAASKGKFSENIFTDLELTELQRNEESEFGRSNYSLTREFWSKHSQYGSGYFASLDLEKFYPSIKKDIIQKALKDFSQQYNSDLKIQKLVEQLLSFQVKSKSNSYSWQIEPNSTVGNYDGLPTGLLVSGFLSNVAMLPVDNWAINNAEKFGIAHFRFVDDHSFVGANFDNLITYMYDYVGELKKYGLNVNSSKTEPPEIQKIFPFIQGDESERQIALKASSIQGVGKRKIITATLAKMSDIGQVDFDLLGKDEQSAFIDDLRHLMTANIGDDEVRSSTRRSFSLARICRFIPILLDEPMNILLLRRKHKKLFTALNNVKMDELNRSMLLGDFEKTEAHLKEISLSFRVTSQKKIKHIFSELLLAVHEDPMKARLWAGLVKYMRKTGTCFLSEMITSIYSQIKDSDMRNYLGRLLLQELIKECIFATAAVSKRETLSIEKDAAYDFLSEIKQSNIRNLVKLANIDVQGQNKIQLLATVFFASIKIIESDKSRILLPQSLGNLVKELGFGEIKDLTEVLSPGDQGAIIFWLVSKLPMEIDERFWFNFNLLLSGSSSEQVTMKHYISPIYDARFNITATLEKPQLLLNWNQQKSKKNGNDFDPRFGEWTAIVILEQMIDIANQQKLSASEIHMENFEVPDEWMDEKLYSDWQKWHRTINDYQLNIVSEGRMSKPSILGSFAINDLSNEQASAFAAGLILWQLVRKSNVWPKYYTMPGQERMLGKWLMRDISNYIISSYIIDILKSCLTPRGIENSTIKGGFLDLFNKTDTDINTLSGDIIVRDLEDLKINLMRAKMSLEKGQISIAGGHPRQLTPVDLTQFDQFADPEEI